ncbi:MAG: T9SS type A sorting domain-containing protein [Bacteroidota bacterium]
MKKIIFLFGIFLVLLATLSDLAWSADRRQGVSHQPTGLYKIDGTPISTLINTNNVAGWIRNDGWSARIPSSGNSGVFFPRGTAAAIFQDGIVWGGNVNDGGSQVLRVGGQTYQIGTIGGRIISPGVAADPNAPDVRIYRIRRDYATADLRRDAAEVLEKGLNAVSDGDIAGLRAQYQTDWNEWPADQGAPYYDRDLDGSYNPAVDEPGVADADQVIWFVCNDLNAGLTNALYGSNPIGFELQVTLWGYDRTDPLANVYFKKFTFIYKGTATTPPNATITDMYVGQWSDPDMGDAGDDYSGCDTTLSLGYVYNGDASDNDYAAFGLVPPAVGYDFLQGPIVDGAPTDSAVFGLKRVYGKRNLPMTAAFYFAAGGTFSDPPFSRQGSIQWYNLLRGLTPIDGTEFIHPQTPGEPSRFWLDGDPTTGSGRIDGFIDAPGDRRLGVCSGPFTMALGDTQEIVIGVVAGIGSDRFSSITSMKNNDIAVQSAYDALFDLPKAPPAPVVRIVEGDEQIVLDWSFSPNDVNATELFDAKGYTFQGYNLYQVQSPSTQIPLASDKRDLDGLADVKLLATYDRVDAIRTIVDNSFDPGLGIVVQIVRQRGTDSGVRRIVEIEQDAIRQAPLVNGQRYYFAVTAYGYNPSDQALTHALESTPAIITVIPRSANPGIRQQSVFGDTITTVVHDGPSDGFVVPIVVDPQRISGHTYTVTFDLDTTSGETFWKVDDVTAGEVKLSAQANQSGDESYHTVDGMQIKVFGAPNDLKDLQHVAGPTGAIDPPTYGAFAFNGWGFPTTLVGPTGPNNPNALVDRPEADWGGGQWGIHTGGAGAAGDESYLGRFVPRVFRGDNFDRFVPFDFELRFTAAGGRAWLAFTSENVIDVPFEIWNIGINTPNDPSDDYQMIPWLNDADGNEAFNLQQVDHALSGGNNDPYTDWIYWYQPTNTAPGSGGYQTEFVAFGAGYDGTDGAGNDHHEVMARVVLANWNGGSVSDPSWPANANSIMPGTGNIIRIFSTKPNQPGGGGDTFTINTASYAATYSAEVAKADISAINVFPNPYYGFNRAETTRFQRFVTFNHLPQKAEVRIFNLAGALVKSIAKDDGTQFLNWDLSNHGGLPVASGLYIAYLTLKDAAGVDLGTKTLKLVIIQEQQYLDNF